MKNRFQTLLFKCNLHRYSLGRGVDLVLAPPAGGSDRPAVANVRIWQLNVGETDGRRAGVRTLQVVAPAGVVSDADGVVWSGELSQGTGFEDHAPHVVVNLVPGCEGTVLPLDGADERDAERYTTTRLVRFVRKNQIYAPLTCGPRRPKLQAYA